MFYQILRSFLGPFANVLDFFATRTEWITAFFILYLGMYGIGLIQLNGIRKRTRQLMQAFCKQWLENHPRASDQELFKRFYPAWETEFRTWRYFFIPNKHDLWPVTVTVENVLTKMPLSPEYVHNVLAEIGLREPLEEPKIKPKPDIHKK